MSLRMDIIKRDDSDFELTFTDVDGEIIDLTDGVVFFTVKKNVTDADDDAILQKEIDYFEHPATGVCTFSLTPTDTDILPGDYYFDIQLKNKSNRISSSAVGKFIVKQDITVRTDFS